MTALNKNTLHELLTLANRHERAGDAAQAEACYLNAVERDPACDAAWHALGLLALQRGKGALAVQRVETAIVHNPGNALYHRNLCELQRRQGQLRKAEAAGLQACRLAPADCDAHYNLGLVYADAKQPADAVRLYRLALQCNPEHGMAWNNLGSALEQLDDIAAAQAAYEKAIAINPRHVEAQINLGLVLARQGRNEAARRCHEAALAAQPDSAEAHYHLSLLTIYAAGDAQLAALEKLHAASPGRPVPARIRICFALGNALCDVGAYDRAFALYEQGHRLQHELMPTDDARDEAELERMLGVFTKEWFARRAVPADDDARTPVLIVGLSEQARMLAEHALAGHSALSVLAQPNALRRAIAPLLQPGQPGLLADAIAQLSQEDLQTIGQAYLERAWQPAPGSACVLDQAGAGFFYAGLLRLAVPRAKIIHVTQDPMQSCWETYARLPQHAPAVGKDQAALGRHYVRHRKLMQHWHAILPPGSILDMAASALQDDAEGSARAMLDFIGLPAEKGEPLSAPRRVIRSAPDWRHVARHLHALYDVVKDWMPAGQNVPQALLRAPLPDRKAEALHDEGIRRYKQNRLDEALALFEQALAMRPVFPEAFNSKGYVLQDLGRLDEALTCFARSVALAPESSVPRLNLGMLQLKLGQWQEGWENYEARWTGSAEANKGSIHRPHCLLPAWNGEADTQDKRLLVITEQGFGDTFQFARYLPLLTQRFAKVGFGCPSAVHRLMEWSFSDEAVLFTRMPADMQHWDLQCSVMSLPRAFGTRPTTIPPTVPYLRVPRPARLHWQERIEAAAPGKLRVGIAWAGRKTHHLDARRSLEFAQLSPLFAQQRVAWFSLQKWTKDDARPAIPSGLHWVDWTEELADFADTAAMLCGLDLVISVDSAMVHLAGALGRPVWMMNRFDGEWRWFHRRSDSPWYPALRIFNAQQFGRWQDVVDDIASALSGLANAAAPR